jgi:ADP-heptose:LPS heptosyltransferase
MNLITFNDPITIAFKKSAGGVTQTFEANRPYLIANAQIERIMRDQQVSGRAYKISRADTRIPNAHKAAFNRNDSVLIYNGSGGYGDQILTWPVARYLANQGLKVHVLTDPGNNVCWWGFDFVKTVNTIPLLWETVQLYDHFIHWEAVVNMDEHQDQEHPIDMMFRKIGYDPADISAEDKCVRPVFTPSELGTLNKYVTSGKRVGLYQLSSANPVRCLPAADSVFLIMKIAEAYPDIHWLCLHDEFVPKEYKETLAVEITKRGFTNVEGFTAPNLRELWALTEHVNVVISPDSMMAHIAGAFGTPCVGLWGPMSPESRMKYYKNHHPIYHREFCPHSPCFVYSNTFPKYCPPRANRNVCDVMAGISPSEVISAIGHICR